MKAVILAAGVGSRIGNPRPKSLALLPTGDTILGNQIKALRESGIIEIIVVVGFKKEFIVEEFPELLYHYNPFYHLTNTSKSLLGALKSIKPDDVIWLNGDVVLESGVVSKVISANGNIIAVNTEKCSDEEIKYLTNVQGFITDISKSVQNAEGEAVGVNKICADDLKIFIESLEQCDDNDYFEKGIEIAINKDINFKPVDISEFKCIEVDFIEDYHRAKEMFAIKESRN